MTQGWVDELNDRMRDAVRLARGARSAAAIAAETERLGYPLSRSLLANFENGRKQGLDVAELIVLAAALGVAPAAVVFPCLPAGQVEMLPGQPVPAEDALRWFSGEVDDVEGPRPDLAELLKATRDKFALEERLAGARGTVDYLATLKLKDERAEMLLWQSQLLVNSITKEIEELNSAIANIPGAVVDMKDSAK